MNSRLARSTRLVQLGWLAAAIAGTFVFFGGPISQWSTLTTICHTDKNCQPYQLGEAAARTLSARGISATGFAGASVGSLVVFWLLWYGLASLIIVRRPRDRGALLAA